jgi:dUTP pyrophosphatase
MPLFVKKLDSRATLPTVAHPGEDLAYDLYAIEDMTVDFGVVTKVHTGIAVEHVHACNKTAPYEHVTDGLLIRDRSSMAAKGIFTHGGVIDAGYRGEIMVLLSRVNDFPHHYEIKAGDKIAQMIPIPVLTGEGVLQIEEFTEETSRQGKGFGSSGR